MMFRLFLFLVAFGTALTKNDLTKEQIELAENGLELLDELYKIQSKIKELEAVKDLTKESTDKIKYVSRVLNDACQIRFICPKFVTELNKFCDEMQANLQKLEKVKVKSEFKEQCNGILEEFQEFVNNGIPDILLKSCQKEMGPLAKILEKVKSFMSGSNGVNMGQIISIVRGILGGGLVVLVKMLGSGGIDAVLGVLGTVETALGTLEKIGITKGMGVGEILNSLGDGNGDMFGGLSGLLGEAGFSLNGLLSKGGLLGSVTGGGGIGNLLGGLLGKDGLLGGILNKVLDLVVGLLSQLLGLVGKG